MSAGGAGLLARVAAAVGAAWPRVQAVATVAEARGETLWLVGGAVRDLLLGRGIQDVDLVVEGDAVGLAEAVADAHGGAVVRHRAFGTAKWVPEGGGEALDLATARTETYPAPASLPVVAPAAIRADLGRRDFSINAMAIGLSGAVAGRLLDPFFGAADLEAGLLRVLHPASFVDDPTRMYRAARFASRFRFSLEEGTADRMRSALSTGALHRLGLERLGAEFDRLLAEDQAWFALVKLCSWHVNLVPAPALFWTGTRAGHWFEQGTRLAALATGWAPDRPVRPADVHWLVLSHGVRRSARVARARMVPGGRAAQARYVSGLPDAEIAAVGLRHGRRGQAGHVFRRMDPVVCVLTAVVGDVVHERLLEWWLTEGRHVRLGLDGGDLIAAGVLRGPAIGRALAAAWSAAWEGGDAAAQRRAALDAAAQPRPA